MQIFDAAFGASLTAAQDGSIAPIYFLWVVARDRETGAEAPIGLWSGDEDITITIEQPDGGSVSRTYLGACNLEIDGIQYVADLTDNPVSASLSQLAPAAQLLVRGLDVRLAYCEIHATTWTGGALTSAPQLQWIGIVDEGPISTPGAGGEGGIALSIRSEIMTQLGQVSPAKSSDAHQRRRLSADRFCEYSGIIGSRSIQWYRD